MSNCERQM